MNVNAPKEIKDARQMYRLTHSIAKGILEWVDEQKGVEGRRKMGLNSNSKFLTMDLLEKIVRRLPGNYVRLIEARGHERLFASGEYEILKPIPSMLVFDALKDAGILKK